MRTERHVASGKSKLEIDQTYEDQKMPCVRLGSQRRWQKSEAANRLGACCLLR